MLNEQEIKELNARGLYTTGQFAKMFDIEKSMLHYYDSIGLISPQTKGENNYRYYSWQQFDEITLILTLRELDMPVSAIKEYIKNRTPEKFAKLLNETSTELEERLGQILRLQKFINGRRKITEEALNATLNEIKIQHFPKDFFYVTSFDGDPYVIEEVYHYEGRHNKTLKLLDIYSPYPVGEITHIDSISEDKIIHHNYFQTKLTSKNDYSDPWVHPEGDYLTIYHEDGYWKTPKYHKLLLAYAKKNGLKTDEFFYDEYLLDEMSTNTLNSYLIRVSLRIK